MIKFDDSKQTEQQKKLNDIQSWPDLFRFTIELAKRETHCGTLAYYKSMVQEFNSEKGYGIAMFSPFPITTDQEQYYINVYFFKEQTGIDLVKPDNEKRIYCIMFMDYNFISSLNVGRVTSTKDTELHSLTYAILIDTL